MLLVQPGKQLLARVPPLERDQARVELVVVELHGAARVEEDAVKVAPVPDRLGRQRRRLEPRVERLLVRAGRDGVGLLHHRRAAPQRRGLGRSGDVVGDVVQGVDLFQRAEPALEVVDDGPRHVRLGAVGADARPPVDVVVDGGFFILRVCEV